MAMDAMEVSLSIPMSVRLYVCLSTAPSGLGKQDPNYLATMAMDTMEVSLSICLSFCPLLCLGWNKQDPNYLATMAMDAREVSLSVRPYVCPSVHCSVLGGTSRTLTT